MKKLLVVLIAVLAFAGMATAADSGSLGIKGGYVSYTDAPSSFSGFALGVDYKFDLGGILLAPEFMYGVASNSDDSKLKVTGMEFNFNFIYPIKMGGFNPYIGAGLGYMSFQASYDGTNVGDAENKIGFNLIAGGEFELGSVNPFVEFRYVAVSDDYSHIMLLGGVNIKF